MRAFTTGGVTKSAALLSIGMLFGVLITHGWAAMVPPTEHKGLEVGELGVVSEDSMEKQIGLSGYKLQLRKITIMPGGQIAKHSHENRPGLVQVISGTWVEGRDSGEVEYSSNSNALLEDENTVHWFWNRGDQPATAYVCDIVPAG